MNDETLAQKLLPVCYWWRRKSRKTKATVKPFALKANAITKFSNAKTSRMLKHYMFLQLSFANDEIVPQSILTQNDCIFQSCRPN